jgi:hypothetical protein
LDERDIGQSRAAESRPQLEPLLKHFLVIFIRCVFDDNSVVPFADFTALFGLALSLLWDFDKSRRRSTPGTARKEADRLLVEFPCTPTRTGAM